jgi:hypothetical protein
VAPDRARGRGLERAILTLDRGFERFLPLVAFLVAGVGVLFRQSGVPKALTIWAEDGLIFAGCAYARPFLDCLVEPYAGWMLVVPRIGAAVATLWPPADLSVVLALFAAAVAGLTAAVVAIAVRDACGSWPASLVAGASLVLVYQAGNEVGGNLTNLHWILVAGSIVLIVAWWVGARPGPGGLALVAATGLSSPFTPILVALVLIGALLRRPGWRPLLAITLVTALVQIAVVLTTPRVPPGRAPFDVGVVISHYVRDVLALGAFGPMRIPLNWLVPVGVVGAVVVAVVLAIDARRAPDDSRSESGAAGWRSLIVIAALVGTGIALFAAMLFLQQKYNARYAYVPSALLCVALAFGSALVRGTRPGRRGGDRTFLGWVARLILPAAVLLLAVGFARTFRFETKASDGPDYTAAYRAASTACLGRAATSIRVPISPAGGYPWAVEIPCSRVTQAPGR